jgi:hypothetical protein
LLWRLGRRRGSRRLVFLSALVALLLIAPQAAGVPGDPTAPVITPLYSPAKPGNGWFRGSVTLNWAVVDSESIILDTNGCGARTLSVDTPGEIVTCWAKSDGGEQSQSVTIKIDKSPPAVSTVAERVPDANGWYNRALTVSFAGSDPVSGIASCSPPVRYSGPDNATALVAGSCSDIAGNSAPGSLGFKYDSTAPNLFAVTAKRLNRSAELAWRKSSDTRMVQVLRAPGKGGAGESVLYQGSATVFRDRGLIVGRKYEYRVAGLDDAGNRAEQKADVVATGPLLSPTPGERVKAPPYLIWTAVKKASYYNIQLVRGRKVLSAWPARPGFRLRRTWSYNGRRYRLRPGVYRWYVWPGFGKISESRYGRLLGSSTFVVAG